MAFCELMHSVNLGYYIKKAMLGKQYNVEPLKLPQVMLFVSINSLCNRNWIKSSMLD